MPDSLNIPLANPGISLKDAVKDFKPGSYHLKKNTAMLVVHGIGNQRPLETLDQFGRGLVEEYKSMYPGLQINLTHVVQVKPSDDDDEYWFDNVVRLNFVEDGTYIDLYEYYWANYTEDKATFGDMQKWLNGVVKGAKTFYKEIALLDKTFSSSGPFFDNHGNFIYWKYSLFLKAATYLIPIIRGIVNGLLWLVSFIPFVGSWLREQAKSLTYNLEHDVSNVIGDLVVYNVSDPKSKYYCVRRQILDGAVDALTYLIQKKEGPADAEKLSYPSVIVAGHSLGSQVSYDAINKLNLLINKNKVKNYDATGKCKLTGETNINIKDQLNGYITFGSPLDKIAFFLRDIVPHNMYLRRQLLEDFHGFKQKNWSQLSHIITPGEKYEYLQNTLVRLLDDVKWRNYHDGHDYVSGSLDYYDKLTNVDCAFGGNSLAFTHSNYWECPGFYRDIIMQYLV